MARLNFSPKSATLHGVHREELEFATYILLSLEFIPLSKTSDKVCYETEYCPYRSGCKRL